MLTRTVLMKLALDVERLEGHSRTATQFYAVKYEDDKGETKEVSGLYNKSDAAHSKQQMIRQLKALGIASPKAWIEPVSLR